MESDGLLAGVGRSITDRRPPKAATPAWQRFEAKVDPAAELPAAERARRAKIAYRTFMRSIARKSVKARAAAEARRDATVRRRVARGPTEKELAEFHREREEWITALIVIAAAQRGERGIACLRRRQLRVRPDC